MSDKTELKEVLIEMLFDEGGNNVTEAIASIGYEVRDLTAAVERAGEAIVEGIKELAAAIRMRD